ncbi:MAG: hypothetical protein MUQ56_12920 [Thermoleophilia bacterium]|nr:hypothetical protein [Thermoleophilia bacterium]
MEILDDPPLLLGHPWLGDTWTKQALFTCEKHIVPCGDLLKLFDRLQALSDSTARVFSPRDREGLEEGVAREALSPEKTKELYRRALARVSPLVWQGVYENQEDAAFRIYDERIRDLYPAADAFLQGDWTGDKSRVIAARRVALASAGPQPVSALLALVREAEAWNVDSWSLPDPKRYEALSRGRSDQHLLLRYALAELRRRDLAGTLEGLKEIMKLYEKEHILAAHPDSSEKLRNAIRSSRWLKEEFGSDLAEAIGDFGDHQLEREVLGGRCLWDMVSEAEKAMVAKKLLAPRQMVTTETQ